MIDFELQLKSHIHVFESLLDLKEEVSCVVDHLCEALDNGNKVLLCGNGGSAADSQHLAAEFVGRFLLNRRPLPAIALTTDTSALTCIANDFHFDDVFARQVEALGCRGDCLIAISTSGNSSNVINAVKKANKMGLKTIGLLGCSGGELSALCSTSLVVKSDTTARIQEAHIFLGHVICADVEYRVCGD